MSIKRGVWRQGESQLAKDDGCEELVISDDPEIGGGTNPYDCFGTVAVSQFPPRQHGARSSGGCNPYEHGAKSPERAWEGAGLDTRDCDNKTSWLDSRLAGKAGWPGATRARTRGK